MRYAIAASAVCGLVAAAPQMINIGAALAVPTPTILGPNVEETKAAPVSYNPSAAASEVAAIVLEEGVTTKRRRRNSVCGPQQPGGAGPVPGDGSVSAYTDENNDLRKDAVEAGTPGGYKKSFTNLLASTEQIGYLAYKNIESGTYDVQACADFCDSEKFCLGFNIFYERDPKFEPKDGCANPEPITNVKCSIYGYPVSAKTATNEGQMREGFQVVITGSNGYSKLDVPNTGCKAAPAVPDFKAPIDLPATIWAPLDNGKDTYNGMRLFNENPYDPSLCAAACEAQTQFDREHLADANGNYKPCNFFTSYILTQNDVPLGTYCSLYTRSWDESYATNSGFQNGDDKFSVVCAASYEASTIDSGNKGTVVAPGTPPVAPGIPVLPGTPPIQIV